MEVNFICRYCDYKWIRRVYGYDYEDFKCPKCGDKNPIAKEINKVDYYGKGPIKEKEKETPKEDINGTFDWHSGETD